MMTPALSFDAIIAAMMCLCTSKDNTPNNMYQTDAIEEIFQRMNVDESVVFVKNDVIDFKEKIDNLERTFKDIQDFQERILSELNINSSVPVVEGAVTACSTRKQITNIKVPKFQHPFQVLCNTEGWLVIQQRYDGSVNFFKTWSEYEHGFGSLQGEFFIGLDKLNAITTAQTQELRIELEDFDGDKRFAHYDQFEIGSANEGYALKILGKYDGNAGDSLSQHKTHKFSTYDRDNDVHQRKCAVEYTGAWWYSECETSNLNGQYLKGKLEDHKIGKGMSWNTFRGLQYSLKSVKMLIKPKN